MLLRAGNGNSLLLPASERPEDRMAQGKEYLHLQVNGSNETVSIPVGVADKPFIPEDIVEKWQAMVDILVEFADASVGLVVRAYPDGLKALVISRQEDSPVEESCFTDSGGALYCKSVLGHNAPLRIRDATAEPFWKDGPAVAKGLIAYYGLPLQWPDDDFFGSICLHDRKVNDFSGKISRLMSVFKDNIEKDLSIAYMNFHALKSVNKRMLNDIKTLESVERDLLRALEEKELLLDEVHFRIKNNLQLISELLGLQREGSEPAVAEKIHEIRNCILLMKVIHDLFREGDGQSGLSLASYLSSLVSFLGPLYSAGSFTVEIAADFDSDVFLDMRQATLIGLAVNHVLADVAGKKDDREVSAYSLSVDKEESGLLTIIIIGLGLVKRGRDGSESVDRSIVQALAERLNGNCGFPSEGNTLFYLQFPVQEHG